jgi:hypothetical protein
MADFFIGIGVDLAAVALLHMLFSALRIEWPHSYYSVSDFVEYR